MKLSWYSTAAILLESEGYRIVFDPFLGMQKPSEPFRRMLRKTMYRSADAVVVTHGHFDHIYDIPALYRDSDIKIYAAQTPCESLKREGVGEEKLCTIAPGDILTLGGFTIRVYQGRHCRFDAGVMLKTVCKTDTLLRPKSLIDILRIHALYPENGETLFFEIEAEGKRIHLMGSMGMDETVDYPTGADALILPFQGTSDPARTVRPIIAKLRPKRIYLDHYDNAFPPMSSQVMTIDFAARMMRRGIPTAALKFAKGYEI